MADGYLEQHMLDYEKRKQAWLKKKNSFAYQLSKKSNGKNTTNPA